MDKKIVLVLIDCPQDLDLLLPVIRRLKSNCIVWVTDHALERSRRIEHFLNLEKSKWCIKRRILIKVGVTGSLAPFNSLLTACESSLRPHRVAYRLTKKFTQQRKKTWTLQHGFENVGLSYFDGRFKTKFNSDFIGVWGNDFLLDSRMDEAVRARCVPIGLTKNYDLIPVPDLPDWARNRRVISVFENLHWDRYSQSYKRKFIHDLKSSAEAFPDYVFILKSHHDERWLASKQDEVALLPGNIVVADPKKSQWQLYTAAGLIKISDLVITTPSTVAVDAALMRKPVSVVGYDLNLDMYDPLCVLRSLDDWKVFVNCECLTKVASRSAGFSNRWIQKGDAVTKLIARLL